MDKNNGRFPGVGSPKGTVNGTLQRSLATFRGLGGASGNFRRDGGLSMETKSHGFSGKPPASSVVYQCLSA